MAEPELNSSLCQLNWLLSRGGSQETASSSSSSPKSRPASFSTRTTPPADKPPYSYAQLIRMAIENNPDKKCSLSGIYAYVSNNFPFYRNNNSLSWKNSIRHNLSLNRQFRRLEKQDGEKGACWVIASPEEKKRQRKEGSPTRINPAVEKMYMKSKILRKQSKKSFRPSTDEDERYSKPPPTRTVVDDRAVDPATISLFDTGTSCAAVDQRLTDAVPEEDLNDLVLFTSHDMSASFKQVYDQVFHQKQSGESQEEIDWLKIGLEAAGVDYRNEEELQQLDTDRFSHFLRSRVANNAQKVMPSDLDDFSCPSSLTRRDSLSSVEDDFDWTSIL